MTNGGQLASFYQVYYFLIRKLMMRPEDIEELVPYEVDLFLSMWAIEQKKKAEKPGNKKG
jgi:hypothetical protein